VLNPCRSCEVPKSKLAVPFCQEMVVNRKTPEFISNIRLEIEKIMQTTKRQQEFQKFGLQTQQSPLFKLQTLFLPQQVH
ncbi:MAG: hypothetical protein WD512_05305, partial [Candidatus Paceibacterota bacterium]